MKKFGLALMVVLMAVDLMAGTATGATVSNSAGLGGAADALLNFFDDKGLTTILALMLFVVGVWRLFAGSVAQFGMMMGIAVLITQGRLVVTTIGGAGGVF